VEYTNTIVDVINNNYTTTKKGVARPFPPHHTPVCAAEDHLE